MEGAFGANLTRVRLSEDPGLRLAAMALLSSDIVTRRRVLTQHNLRGYLDALQVGLDDPAAPVFLSATKLVRVLVAHAPRQGPGAPYLAAACRAAVPLLMAKVGDDDQQLWVASHEAVSALSIMPAGALAGLVDQLQEPFVNLEATRRMQGFLLLLENVLSPLGLSEVEGGAGFSMYKVLANVRRAYTCGCTDVYVCNALLLRRVHRVVGSLVLDKYLLEVLQGVHPNVRRHVEAVLARAHIIPPHVELPAQLSHIHHHHSKPTDDLPGAHLGFNHTAWECQYLRSRRTCMGPCCGVDSPKRTDQEALFVWDAIWFDWLCYICRNHLQRAEEVTPAQVLGDMKAGPSGFGRSCAAAICAEQRPESANGGSQMPPSTVASEPATNGNGPSGSSCQTPSSKAAGASLVSAEMAGGFRAGSGGGGGGGGEGNGGGDGRGSGRGCA